MPDQLEDIGPVHPDGSRRAERAERILDVAAALILRWGYNKTTIDDVARQAGVAKGTIYLHWKTREELFMALMQREKAALALDLEQRVAADPQGATLRGIFKHSALGLMQRPLLKAAILRDIDVIGKLAQSEFNTATYAERLAGFTTYLNVLREHGLVRTDISLQAQVYVVSAVFMGFFLVAPLMPAEFALTDAELADLLAETVHRTLQSSLAAPPEGTQAVAGAFTHYLDGAVASAQEQFQHAVDDGRARERSTGSER